MRNTKALFTVFFFLCVVCSSVIGQDSENLLTVFDPIDAEVKVHRWGMNNQIKATIFEDIYNKYYENRNFYGELNRYCDSGDKCYWIGIYLNSSYTKISNFDWSIEILKKGLTLNVPEPEQVRLYYAIGKAFYYNNQVSEAIPYLVKGYNLGTQYPGTTPGWNSKEEYDAIIEIVNNNM